MNIRRSWKAPPWSFVVGQHNPDILPFRQVMIITRVYSNKKAREKPCLRCGYSLRYLVDSRNCPECGLAVWLSLGNNDALDWSNPVWLKRLSILCCGMAALQFVTIWVFAGIALLPALEDPLVQTLATGISLALYHAALYFVAENEKRHPDLLKPYRVALRCLAVGGAALGVGTVYYGVVVDPENPLPGAYNLLAMVLALVSSIVTFAYLRKLARRLHGTRLVRLTRYLLMLPVLTGLLMVMMCIFNLLDFTDYLFIGASWAYLAGATILMTWYAAALGKAAKAARVNWATETAL